MRCPECNQRNSVAAKHCTACGGALLRKPLPLASKIVLGSMVGLLFVVCLAALSTTLNNPEKTLTNAAKRLTGKSSLPEHGLENFRDFDQAVRAILQKFGTLNNAELSEKLAANLPKSLYEAHVFELLPDVRLVEIDTALNASDYLILLQNDKADILPVMGLGVFEASSLLPQSANSKLSSGQMLVMLGHTTGVSGGHPTVKILHLSTNLQPENITDLTDSVVPKIYGEGSAKFAVNKKDIDLSTSLLSRGQELNLFAMKQPRPLPFENENLFEQLLWSNNHYLLHAQPGTSKLCAIYAAVASLANRNKIWRYHSYLTNNATHVIVHNAPITSSQGFTIRPYGTAQVGTAGNVFELVDDSHKIIVALRPISENQKKSEQGASTKWIVDNLAVSKESKTAAHAAAVATKSSEIKTEENKPAENKIPLAMQPDANKIEKSPTVANKSVETPVPKIESKPQPTVPYVLPANFIPELKTVVKLRSGPGTTYQVLHQLMPETHIAIIGKSGDWYQVKVGDQKGYILGELVKNRGTKVAVKHKIKNKKKLAMKESQMHPPQFVP